jgi:hypothetical protein
MIDYQVCEGYAKRIMLDSTHLKEISDAWTKIKVSTKQYNAYRIAMREWAETNSNDFWAGNLHIFYFKNEKDAIMFALRWL